MNLVAQKKKKAVLLSIVIGLVLIVGVVALYGVQAGPQETVNRFMTALQNEDTELLHELIESDDERMVIQTGQLKQLSTYVKKINLMQSNSRKLLIYISINIRLL
ncbi:hypothetical protein IC620_14890 [Hazenella sp. IB182357]|uniref:TcaA second domain-containing protein n=1 Tax=Polycladospora coralii TaxID=2771432 RepID=A0A926N7X5_9BACL|nr:hypothetical protein [Polycladospora coralii]MBD1373631.1 hypothetical protein [Polycladospora coralii]MBS7529672.1 hypothetical protein [Polycladospora coralii]